MLRRTIARSEQNIRKTEVDAAYVKQFYQTVMNLMAMPFEPEDANLKAMWLIGQKAKSIPYATAVNVINSQLLSLVSIMEALNQIDHLFTSDRRVLCETMVRQIVGDWAMPYIFSILTENPDFAYVFLQKRFDFEQTCQYTNRDWWITTQLWLSTTL
jgi:hypothetical protein